MSARAAVVVVASALAVAGAGLLLASCGGDDGGAGSTGETTTTSESTETTTETTEPATPTEVTIVVRDGVPEGGIVRESVDEGEEVVLVVTSDVSDEIHLHGYDVSRDVAAGGTVRVPFTATIPGRFEVELENAGVQIAEITVNP